MLAAGAACGVLGHRLDAIQDAADELAESLDARGLGMSLPDGVGVDEEGDVPPPLPRKPSASASASASSVVGAHSSRTATTADVDMA